MCALSKIRIAVLIVYTRYIASKMPVFEDKRKLKLPTFAGLDIYQNHIRNAAAALKASEIVTSRLIYDIPVPTKLPGNK